MRFNGIFQVVFNPIGPKTQKTTAAPHPYSGNNLTNPKSVTDEPVYVVDGRSLAADAKSHNATCEETHKRAS